jgi:hypothetical protein
MLCLAALLRTEVSEELLTLFLLADFCHPDDGGDTVLPNVRYYKSHTAQHLRRR